MINKNKDTRSPVERLTGIQSPCSRMETCKRQTDHWECLSCHCKEFDEYFVAAWEAICGLLR